MSLVEAITQGILRGMEALLQRSSFSARLPGTTLACHSYSFYTSPLVATLSQSCVAERSLLVKSMRPFKALMASLGSQKS